MEYQKPEDAAKAILQLNNLPVQHKRIKVSYARPPGEDIKETNLYIQNIPRLVTQHTSFAFWEMFTWLEELKEIQYCLFSLSFFVLYLIRIPVFVF